MFKIENKQEDGFAKVILHDERSGTFAEIVPSCGAIMVGFTVIHNGEMMNIIDHYDSEKDFKENVTAKGFLGCKLSPFVCRINKGIYHFGEKDYRIEKFYLGNNALHGLIYDRPFTLDESIADKEKASISMSCKYDGSDKGYPFKYKCLVTYSLFAGDKLEVKTTITNLDDGLIPIQDGWHPYFTLGCKIDDCQFEFQSKELVEFDEELIPTGRLIPYEEFGSLKKMGDTFFDNCFTLNFSECQPLCVLRNPEKKIQVEIHPDKSYPYLQMYTPAHRNSIALENISSAPDAFNNGMGLQTLESGEVASFTTTYIITSVT